MAPLVGMYFDGTTRLTGTHDSVQVHVGNATCINDFIPPVVDYKTSRRVVVMAPSEVLFMLCDCGRVCHVHRLQFHDTA